MNPELQRDRERFPEILEGVLREAVRFLEGLDARPAAIDPPRWEPGPLPEQGSGALEAVRSFSEQYGPYLSGSAGPRYFGFVTGGSTPAAVAGDWLTSVFDQNAQLSRDTCAPWVELEALSFLRDLFGLPAEFTGSFVSGATMSNFVSLAIARQVLGRQMGHDVAEEGLWGLPPVPVLAGAAHSSIGKALSMLGMGRKSVVPVACRPDREAVDLTALEDHLARLEGKPAIVAASCGTVNTTDFDDLEAIGRLKERYPFWLHVDGAFGLFAACSPRFRHFVQGIEAADSVTVDCHKWLNVPYDSAVQFTRHLPAQIDVFQNVSPYLGRPEPLPNNYLHLVPENSRRFRALAAWMTLRAYGREGYREIVERNSDLAADLGARLEASGRFRLLAPVRLNVACFTLAGDHPAPEAVRAFLDRVRDDGRAFLTATVYHGVSSIRAAFSNWRTGPADVDLTLQALLDALG